MITNVLKGVNLRGVLAWHAKLGFLEKSQVWHVSYEVLCEVL